jgi:hypothetical protein
MRTCHAPSDLKQAIPYGNTRQSARACHAPLLLSDQSVTLMSCELLVTNIPGGTFPRLKMGPRR